MGWHTAQPGDARLNVTPGPASGAELRALEFRTNFEFIYRTPKAGQGNQQIGDVAKQSEVSPENFDGMRLAAKVSATLVTSFVLVEGEPEPDAPAIVAAAHTTVMQVSWPYWREFCQTAFHRMQMPLTLIPLLAIVQQPAPSEPTSSSKAVIAGDVSGGQAKRKPRT